VEEFLSGIGFSEVYTPSLVERDPDREALLLLEPISTELAVLRTTLLPSLVDAARRNAELGLQRIDLFEVARVYLPSGGPLPTERINVAARAGRLRVPRASWRRSPARSSSTPFRAARGVVPPARSAATTGSGRRATVALRVSGAAGFPDSLVAAADEPVQLHDVGAYPQSPGSCVRRRRSPGADLRRL
jgi:hypothetical protein